MPNTRNGFRLTTEWWSAWTVQAPTEPLGRNTQEWSRRSLTPGPAIWSTLLIIWATSWQICKLAFNRYFENQIPLGEFKPNFEASLEERNKYVHKKYVQRKFSLAKLEDPK